MDKRAKGIEIELGISENWTIIHRSSEISFIYSSCVSSKFWDASPPTRTHTERDAFTRMVCWYSIFIESYAITLRGAHILRCASSLFFLIAFAHYIFVGAYELRYIIIYVCAFLPFPCVCQSFIKVCEHP